MDAKESKGETIWSDPYYDETSDITMITTSIPFFNDFGKAAGVVTADIDLVSIQNLINETTVGETGWAFLLNTDGVYIADKDSEKVMKENILNESNENLRTIGRKILDTKKGNDTYLDKRDKYNIYYSQIPQTNWIIGLTISENELYSALDKLLFNMLLVFVISLVIVSAGIIFYTNGLSKKMVDLKSTAESFADGNFTI